MTSQYLKYLAEKLKLRKATNEGVFPHRQINNIKIAQFMARPYGIVFQLRGGACQKRTFQNYPKKWININIGIRPP